MLPIRFAGVISHGEGSSNNVLSRSARNALDNTDIIPLPGRSVSESFIEQGEIFDAARSVNRPCGTSCFETAAEAGLDPSFSGRPRAMLGLVDNTGHPHHAVLGYANDRGQVIIIDRSENLGASFGSGIPAEEYLQNVRTASRFSTHDELVEDVLNGEIPLDAFRENTRQYVPGFPSEVRLQVIGDLRWYLE